LVQHVDRHDLLAAIERQRRKRLLLVQAPAGYGKTVLLAQWREVLLETRARVAWIALEQADRTARRFVATIASALVHAGIDLPQDVLHGANQWRPEDFLEAILQHGERRPGETWLMLEDWHVVESEEVVGLLDTLLRRMPVDWRVALSSRSRPALNLLALRAQGQLTELGKDDLRFTLAETQALITGASLPAPAVAALAEITEGWPIALQLSQMWLSHDGELDALKRSFIDSIEGMAEYLAAEVFATLGPDLRAFLVESSICPRFNSDLADAVRQRSDSAKQMEALKTLHGLAVPLDGRRQWYRHHRIFAEFLDVQRRHLPVERLASLHRGAADWFEREGLLLEAIEHAQLSGDLPRAVALLEGAGCVDICIRFGAPAVRPFLESVPPHVVQSRPRLRTAYAAMSLKRGSIAQAVQILDELRAATAGDPDPALKRDLLIVSNLRHCFIDELPTFEALAEHRRLLDTLHDADWWISAVMHNVQGRLEVRRGLLEEAVKSLSSADTIFEGGGSTHGHFFMLANRAICRLFLGQLGAAERDLNAARLVLAEGLDSSSSYAGVTRTAESVLLYERNDLSRAGDVAHLALAGLEQAEGCFEQYLLSTAVAARSAFAFSGLDAGLQLVDRGRRLARYHGMSRVDRLLDLLQARLLMDGGRWEEAERLIAAQDMDLAPDEIGWIEFDLLVPVLCLAALRANRFQVARGLAADMAGRCRAAGRAPAAIRALCLAAMAAAALDDDRLAFGDLREAVRIATREQLYQSFLEFDARLLPLLQQLQREATDLLPAEAAFLAELILRMVATEKARASVDRLTARERDVLAHLRQGRSNKVIARALDLSENAVKFHMKNVFRKLGVDSRSMAAEVAQRLPLG
jgi:LuxR family maltose regulon positive regulatory protein